jgi:hypothetical protein
VYVNIPNSAKEKQVDQGKDRETTNRIEKLSLHGLYPTALMIAMIITGYLSSQCWSSVTTDRFDVSNPGLPK